MFIYLFLREKASDRVPGWLSGLSACLDLGSGHDIVVPEFESHIVLWAGNPEPAWDPLSPPLYAPPQLTLSLSLSK